MLRCCVREFARSSMYVSRALTRGPATLNTLDHGGKRTNGSDSLRIRVKIADQFKIPDRVHDQLLAQQVAQNVRRGLPALGFREQRQVAVAQQHIESAIG